MKFYLFIIHFATSSTPKREFRAPFRRRTFNLSNQPPNLPSPLEERISARCSTAWRLLRSRVILPCYVENTIMRTQTRPPRYSRRNQRRVRRSCVTTGVGIAGCLEKERQGETQPPPPGPASRSLFPYAAASPLAAVPSLPHSLVPIVSFPREISAAINSASADRSLE